MLTSLVLVCYVGTFCARSILYRCGVLFIVVKATPNAYFLVNEHLHTFFFFTAAVGGARHTNNLLYENKKSTLCSIGICIRRGIV